MDESLPTFELCHPSFNGFLLWTEEVGYKQCIRNHSFSLHIGMANYINSLGNKPKFKTKLTKLFIRQLVAKDSSAIPFNSVGFEGITEENQFYRVKEVKAESLSGKSHHSIQVEFWKQGDFLIAVQEHWRCWYGSNRAV